MAYKKKRQGRFYKFFIISIIIHGVFLYMLSFIDLGIKPAFQSDPMNYNSQLDLLYLEEGVADSQDLSDQYQKDSKSKEKELKKDKEDIKPQKDVKEVKEVEKPQETVEEVKDPQENVAVEEVIEETPEVQEVAKAGEGKQGDKGEKVIEEKTVIKEDVEPSSKEEVEDVTAEEDKQITVADNSKEDIEEDVEEPVKKATQEVQESEEVLTSQSSTEEIKVAQKEVEDKKEAPAKEKEVEKVRTEQATKNQEQNEEVKEVAAEDNKVVKNEKQTEEVKEVPPPPPPPAPKDMILSNVIPRYPKNASNTGIEGDVKLRVKLKASGEIEQVEVVESSEYEQLDNQAKRTVQYGWKFKADKSDYEVMLMVHFRYVDNQNQVDVEYLDLSFDQK